MPEVATRILETSLVADEETGGMLLYLDRIECPQSWSGIAISAILDAQKKLTQYYKDILGGDLDPVFPAPAE